MNVNRVHKKKKHAKKQNTSKVSTHLSETIFIIQSKSNKPIKRFSESFTFTILKFLLTCFEKFKR